MKEIISKFQMITLMLICSCGFIVTLLSYEHFSGSDYPMIILAAAILIAILTICYTKLYRGQGELYSSSSFADKFILFAIIAFLVTIITINFFSSLDFWNIYDYRKNITPIFVIAMGFVIFFCSRFGIEVIARLSFWFLLAIIVIFLINTVLLREKAAYERILPIEFQFDVFAIEQVLFITVLCLPAVLIYLIYSDSLPKCIKTAYLTLPVMAGMLILLTVILRTVFVLGKTNELYAYPLIQTLKLIQFPGGLAGVELFGILVIMSASVFYMILINCAAAFLIAKLFPKINKTLSYALPIAVSVAAYFIFYKNSILLIQPIMTRTAVYAGLSVIILLFLKKFFGSSRNSL